MVPGRHLFSFHLFSRFLLLIMVMRKWKDRRFSWPEVVCIRFDVFSAFLGFFRSGNSVRVSKLPVLIHFFVFQSNKMDQQTLGCKYPIILTPDSDCSSSSMNSSDNRTSTLRRAAHSDSRIHVPHFMSVHDRGTFWRHSFFLFALGQSIFLWLSLFLFAFVD